MASSSSYFDSLSLLPPPPQDPVLTPLPPLFSSPWFPDWSLTIIGPVIAYWALSITFELFDYFDFFARFRLHTPEEVLRRNRVSKGKVAYWVFVQQVLQMGFAYVLSYLEGVEYTGHEQKELYGWYLSVVGLNRWLIQGVAILGLDGTGVEAKIGRGIAGLLSLVTGLLGASELDVSKDWRMTVASGLYWYLIPALRLWVAVFLLDTWQYFLHRLMHTIPSLYRAIHSHHHRLYCPYAFGALYNHPVEGFLMDTIGAGMAFKASGMGQQGAFFFFTFSTLKTVDDHCGYKLPWDPLQWIFANNAEYHDVHHQGWGIKSNFSQPFFICWDRWLNTQWTGSKSSTSERYRKGREQIERLVRDEANGMGKGKMSEHSESSGGEEVQVTQKKVESTTLVLDAVAVEKLVMNGGKILNGLPPTMNGGGEEDSGWDGNSSDGSSGVLGDASPSPRPQRTEEQRELRKRRAAAAR
ncbi:fatty acid hydroxylase superfamily-domain-containing protein [Peziza echinospora]|nr:fatty acid hydroxylase superfamily-domain-containing protein [Peziza echinospora]